MKYLSSFLTKVFGVDVRSLAACRILVSVIILVDIMERLQLFERGAPISDFDFFYTEYGALPQSIINGHYRKANPWSLFFVSSSRVWSKFCFLLYALSAVTYGIGYKTRLSNIVLWFMTVSIHSRAPFLIHGGDYVLKLLLFWSIFLPEINYVASLDMMLLKVDGRTFVRNRPKKPLSKTIVHGGSFAFLCQIAAVYFFSALLKNDPVWKLGDAVNYTMQLRIVRNPWFANFVLQREYLWKFLTLSTYYWEFYGSLLLVACPQDRVRIFVILTFVGMHTGFALSIYLGNFSCICIAYLIAFLPGSFWDAVGWTIECDYVGGKDDDVIVDGIIYGKSTGNTSLNAKPTFEEGILRMYLLMFVDVYQKFYLIMVLYVLPIFLFVLVVIPVNVTRYKTKNLYNWQDLIQRYLKLDQRWGMFAPKPKTDDGWYLLSGQFADGSQLEMWNGNSFLSTSPKRPVMWATVGEQKTWNVTASPELDEANKRSFFLSRHDPNNGCCSNSLKNTRWNLYSNVIWLEDHIRLRKPFAEAVCRLYNSNLMNEAHSPLLSFDFTYMLEKIAGPGLPKAEVEPVFLRGQYCFNYTLIDIRIPPEGQRTTHRTVRDHSLKHSCEKSGVTAFLILCVMIPLLSLLLVLSGGRRKLKND